jgi:hypothetical protein
MCEFNFDIFNIGKCILCIITTTKFACALSFLVLFLEYEIPVHVNKEGLIIPSVNPTLYGNCITSKIELGAPSGSAVPT